MMNCNLWLTLRLLRKQKLRTVTIFCGILFSTFLLTAFCGFGYEFWVQVHGGTGESAAFDSTQGILIRLIVVLLLLILSCAITLLHNLCSLTFPQRWRSLSRLLALGANSSGMIAMALTETLLLFGAAAPAGFLLARAVVGCIGVSCSMPGWMTGAVLLLLLLVSCLCNIRPLLAVPKSPSFQPKKAPRRHIRKPQTGGHSPVFLRFMAKRYRRANRGAYIRAALTILAAILLYVPAGYLISRNIAAQQSGLYTKYGIQYSGQPHSREELMFVLEEYRKLAAECPRDEAMLSVAFYTTASVKTNSISSRLHTALKNAGWQEGPDLAMDCVLLFLEDPVYTLFAGDQNAAPSSVLINRYTNRSSWRADADLLFTETPLLAEGADLSEVEIYTDFTEGYEPEAARAITPAALTDRLPEGIDFTGDLTLILPLSQLETICNSPLAYERLTVQGRFVDSSQDVFSRLEARLGNEPLGRLTDTRKALLEWFDSMKGIHQAMNAICITLFFIAVLNIFSMMVFQYMERKKGLAILWSLGQTTGGLAKIIFLESIHQLVAATLLGIPLSCFLCYYIYRIFRQAWAVAFVLPLRQLFLILAAILLVSFAAFLTNQALIRRLDFPGDIRTLT